MDSIHFVRRIDHIVPGICVLIPQAGVRCKVNVQYRHANDRFDWVVLWLLPDIE